LIGGRRLLAALASVLLAVSLAAAARAETIYLQPLGPEIPEADVALVKTALESFYAASVETLPRLPMPKEAYYPPRQRYRAERLLDFLHTLKPGERILGLTALDISTTKDSFVDWGLLGLGDLDGLAAVISTFRCKKTAHSPQQVRERLAKTAVHEIGHTLGLEHCPTPHCLMQDARGKVSTTDGEYDLCPACRARLKAAGHDIPAAPKIPWARSW
jgi:archaemetzincin